MGKVQADLAVHQVKAVALALHEVIEASEDRSVRRGGFDPGRKGEGLQIAELGGVSVVTPFGRLLEDQALLDGPIGCGFPFTRRVADIREILVQGLKPRVKLRQMLLLIGQRRFDERRLRPIIPHETALIWDLIKECEQTVEILLRDGVVLVIVAAGASDGEAHPHGCGSLRAVGHIFDAILFGDDSAFAAGAVIAIEPRSDLLVECGLGQQIAGELLGGEAVVRHVAVEGIDDPVAPAPHVPRAIGLVAVTVAIAGGFHPAVSHALAVPWRGEEPVNHGFVRAEGLVREKGVNVGGRGREAREIERDAADEDGFVGFGRRPKGFAFEAGKDKAVDRILWPGSALDNWQGRSLRWNEGPEGLPRHALGDPSANQLDFRGDQTGFTGARRRHALAVVRGRDAAQDFGLEAARTVGEIQSEVSLAIGCVGAVAGEAVLGENGANVVIEGDGLGG